MNRYTYMNEYKSGRILKSPIHNGTQIDVPYSKK